MDEPSGSGMIKLTSSNYSIWKSRMEDMLYYRDLYEPIEGDKSKPEKKTEKEWETMHRKTIATIRQWIDQSIFHHVAKETKADVLWKKLESLYERQTAQNKISIIKRVMNLKYKDGQNVTEHLSTFQGYMNQLTVMKVVLEDEVQALLLLNTMLESWETLVVSLSNSAPNGKLTIDMIKDSLLNEEAQRKETGTHTEAEALVTEKRENRGRSQGRSGSRHRGNSRSKSRSRKDIICYNCGKSGHMKRECRKLPKDQRRGNDNRNEKTETVATTTDNDILIVCEDNTVNLTSQDSSWVIDSGASIHVTSRKDFFSSYTSGDFGVVKMGNEGMSKVIGIGDICLETNIGCKLVLKDVRHAPDIRLNLISAGKLDDDGCNNHFGDGQWKLTRGSLVVARGKKECTLYVMQAKLTRDILNAIDDSTVELWHKRLGHMS